MISAHLELCHHVVQPFCTKKLHSFILTELDDGSHLEFCHLGFRHCHLGFKHLVIFSQIHSKTLFLHSDSDLPQTNSIWSDLTDGNPFILNGSHLEFAILDSAILVKNSIWLKAHSQTSSLWLDSHYFQKRTSFILTQLDDGSHLEFCHVGFRHCHLGFRHLVIFSQIHSKTLFLTLTWLKLIQSD